MLKKLFGKNEPSLSFTPVVESFSDRPVQPSDEAIEIVHDALRWADDLYGPYKTPMRTVYSAMDPTRPDDVFWTRYSSYVDGHWCGWGSWWAIWFPSYVEFILKNDSREAAIAFARFCLTTKGQTFVNELTQYRSKMWDDKLKVEREETDIDKMHEGFA